MDMAESHESDVVRVERDQSPTWMIRLGMALVGIALIIGAAIASQTHLMLTGVYGQLLPGVIMLGVLLGAGAIIESIKTSVWITLIAGIAIVAGAYFVTGRYVVNLDASAHAVFVVDRFSGETHYCDQTSCTTLSEGVTFKKVVKRMEDHH
jgi:hypothetical protein